MRGDASITLLRTERSRKVDQRQCTVTEKSVVGISSMAEANGSEPDSTETLTQFAPEKKNQGSVHEERLHALSLVFVTQYSFCACEKYHQKLLFIWLLYYTSPNNSEANWKTLIKIIVS